MSKLDIDNVIGEIEQALIFNVNWYKRRSGIYKYIFYLIAVSTFFIPSLLLYLEAYKIHTKYTAIILIISLFIAALNLALRPFNSWYKFKLAEIYLTSILYRYRIDLAHISSPDDLKNITKRYTFEIEDALTEIANKYFVSINKEIASKMEKVNEKTCA